MNKIKRYKEIVKVITVGVVFSLCMYFGFEYASWVALTGAFISFWVLMII